MNFGNVMSYIGICIFVLMVIILLRYGLPSSNDNKRDIEND